MKKNFIIFILLSAYSFLYSNEKREYLIENCDTPKMWKFHAGKDGAKASITRLGKKNISLNYDFTKGGKYIAFWPKISVPSCADSFYIKFKTKQECQINYRIIDASGRYFQGKTQLIPKTQKGKIFFSTKGPWSAAWGGKENSSPSKPYKRFLITITKGKSLPNHGKIILESFGVTSNKVLKPEFFAAKAELNACNWKIKIKPIPQFFGSLFEISATSNKHNPATISIDFPCMGRDKVFRKVLKENRVFYYRPPLKNNGNVFNNYQIIFKISDQQGSKAQTTVNLIGCKAKGINFGKTIDKQKLNESTTGVCAHFSCAKSTAFRYWAPYEKLIDGIAACGFGWIRDSVRVEKQQDGTYKVRDYDLEWIKYAKKQGLRIILLIRMFPDKTLDEYKKYVEAIVKNTTGLVEVYELGNEPNNYGWKKKFGGSWNGYNPKTKEIDKWVKEHLQFTNALADHIKKIAPATTVIGLGACSPTNFLAVKLGLSKNVDGVVDHPYTYSLPPEKIPFVQKHLKRDGVVVSKNGSFEELMESYDNILKKIGYNQKVWITEFGFPTFWFNGKNEKKMFAGFSEEAQAVYLLRRFILGLKSGAAVNCMYAYLNDYHSIDYNPQANFGIIRIDYSPKLSYFAILRFNSLFTGYRFDNKQKVTISKQALHRNCVRGTLINDWDKAAFVADNEVKAFCFSNPDLPNQKMLAVWSAQPYSREFNNRTCSILLKNMVGFKKSCVAIDLITGRSFDVVINQIGKDFVLDNLVLKGHPIAIKFFK